MNRLQQALEELKKEEEPKKKKKKFEIRKEKRLQYYSGWSRGKILEPEKEEKQNKLDKLFKK